MKYADAIHIVDDRSLPDLSAAPSPLSDDDPCGIGIHKDTPLREVPISYFAWMVRQQAEYPRESRSPQWIRVIQYIRSKA